MVRLLALAACALLTSPGLARQENPVFVDDSTLARDVLAQLPGLVGAGNQSEGVRLLQRLLDEEPDRVIESPTDPDVFVSVRERVHAILLDDPALLERYIQSEAPRAREQLDAGDASGVERSRLLTPAGFEAALRVAREHLESARFESARLTLESLERHPSRRDGVNAPRAAGELMLVATYLDRSGVWERAETWARDAGLAGARPGPVAWPAGSLLHAESPLTPGRRLDVATLVDTPLCSIELRPAREQPDDAPRTRRQTGEAQGPVEHPWMFPAAVDDAIYTTDGLWICAWDRFTLTPRWRVKPPGAELEREGLEELLAAASYRRTTSRTMEECTIPSVIGPLLVTPTGVAGDGLRLGDPRLHALDRETGRVLWSVYVDELDPVLADSSLRGPVLAEGDTAVVTIRKAPQGRRFASAYLAGIDLATGSLRWTRLCGSAGWLGYAGRGQWTDWPTLHQGVVYRVDELGVITAIEAGSGRTRWVRRVPGSQPRVYALSLPWAAQQPIVDGDTLLVLSPDRRELLKLSLHTGEVLARRNAAELAEPHYLVRHGDQVAAVGVDRIVLLPIAKAEHAPPIFSPLMGNPGIVGRVVSAGGVLLSPYSAGAEVFDPSDPAHLTRVPLASSGNMLPLDSQLVVLENARLHAYLVWDEAARVLQERLAKDPADADTAVTFAELAFRAGHSEMILPPLDAALAALARDPLSDQGRQTRERLYALLARIAGASDPAWSGGAAPVVSAQLLGALVERMEVVCQSPDERLTHLLARGRAGEASGRAADALADYRRILGDDALAGAVWSTPTVAVRGAIEASRRVGLLLDANAGPIADAYERDALASVRSFEPEALPAEFERAARLVPHSGAAARAWLLAARAHANAGDALAADAALGQALDAASRALPRGIETALVGEIVGTLASTRARQGHLRAAAEALITADRDWPALALTEAGAAIDRAALDSFLHDAAGRAQTRPRIGAPTLRTAQAIDGWMLMRPLVRAGAFDRVQGVIMLAEGRVASWRFDSDQARLVKAWETPFDQRPALVRLTPHAAVFFEPSDEGGTIVALDGADGRELWRTPPLGDALARVGGAVDARDEIVSPLDGSTRASDLLLAADEQVIAVVTRAGRALGVEARTGAIAWTTRTALSAVHDAQASHGMLALAGAAGKDSQDAVLAVLDLHTGAELSRLHSLGGRARWVMLAGDSRLVAGLSHGVLAASVPEGRVDWLLAHDALANPEAAWAVDDQLYILTQHRDLVLLDARSGNIVSARLDTRGRLEASGPIDLVTIPEGVAFISSRGMVALAGDGAATTIGVDSLEQPAGLVQPVPGRGVFVAFEREAAPDADAYRFHLVEAPSGRTIASDWVELPDPPRRAAIVDNAILVTAGDRTVVIPAPAE